MNKNIINKLITTAFIASVGFAATSVMAAQDFLQQQMTQRLVQSKQKLNEAEATQGTERQKLMEEHMQMLQKNMSECRNMKPKAGMTAKETDEWYAEHQKLMAQMMDQMMEEHHMMMDMNKMDMNKK